jgi:hypothetical protein
VAKGHKRKRGTTDWISKRKRNTTRSKEKKGEEREKENRKKERNIIFYLSESAVLLSFCRMADKLSKTSIFYKRNCRRF